MFEGNIHSGYKVQWIKSYTIPPMKNRDKTTNMANPYLIPPAMCEETKTSSEWGRAEKAAKESEAEKKSTQHFQQKKDRNNVA
ncbi:hypothetical protein AYI68_g1656 [Smittium mucronatum]|uniref:Uncharacterized protein n=1 Tax=Smittium mucronatum TaxID=133383 RepID=A0A1R0H4Y4_9FUNG|nr:hypothetical protein AYI68_g1656 [Smittium mucronatum]